MSDSIEYWHNRQPKCPHCGDEFDVWGGDNPQSLSYEDGGQTTFECKGCRKDFVCVTTTNYVFSTAVSEEAADNEEWGPLVDAEVQDTLDEVH